MDVIILSLLLAAGTIAAGLSVVLKSRVSLVFSALFLMLAGLALMSEGIAWASGTNSSTSYSNVTSVKICCSCDSGLFDWNTFERTGDRVCLDQTANLTCSYCLEETMAPMNTTIIPSYSVYRDNWTLFFSLLLFFLGLALIFFGITERAE
jgi:hypothetical protein